VARLHSQYPTRPPQHQYADTVICEAHVKGLTQTHPDIPDQIRGTYAAAAQLDQVEADIDNLRAAFAWSRENGELGLALGLVSSLQSLWLTRGRVVEGLGWLDTALAEETADDADLRPPRCRALADKGLLLASVGVTDSMAADQALALARELGDPELLVRALVSRGPLSAYDAEVSLPYLEEAADLARQLGDSSRLSQVLNWQATAAMMAGDTLATVAAAEEGLGLADAIGDRFVSRQCRLWVANALVYRGELAKAVALCEEVIAEATAAHDVLMQAIGLMCQNFALVSQGDLSGAHATGVKTMAIASELGEYYEIAYNGAVGLACLAAGDAVGAMAGHRAGKGEHQLAAHDDGHLRRLGGPGRIGVRRSSRRAPVGRRGRVDDEGRVFVVGAAYASPRRNRGWRPAIR
jgi:tetratricopeptide (TPR) repeat protein